MLDAACHSMQPSLTTVDVAGSMPSPLFNPELRCVSKRLMRVCRVDVEAWGSLAESASQQLSKGTQVAIQGRLRQDKWADQSGQTRTRLKVRRNLHVNFLRLNVSTQSCRSRVERA